MKLDCYDRVGDKLMKQIWKYIFKYTGYLIFCINKLQYIVGLYLTLFIILIFVLNILNVINILYIIIK